MIEGRFGDKGQIYLEIDLIGGDEIQEILLGSRWLKLFVLLANYAENRVSLELI